MFCQTGSQFCNQWVELTLQVSLLLIQDLHCHTWTQVCWVSLSHLVVNLQSSDGGNQLLFKWEYLFPVQKGSMQQIQNLTWYVTIMFASFLVATTYGSNTSLSSVSHDDRCSPVMGVQISCYTWKPCAQLSTTCNSIFTNWI